MQICQAKDSSLVKMMLVKKVINVYYFTSCRTFTAICLFSFIIYPMCSSSLKHYLHNPPSGILGEQQTGMIKD